MQAQSLTQPKGHDIMPWNTLDADQKLAQNIAAVFWAAATSDNHHIGSSDSPVYKSMETALIETIKLAYDVPEEIARAARNYLAEYGPYDNLMYGEDNSIQGIESYVRRAQTDALDALKDNRAEHSIPAATIHPGDVLALSDTHLVPVTRVREYDEQTYVMHGDEKVAGFPNSEHVTVWRCISEHHTDDIDMYGCCDICGQWARS